MAWPKNWRRCAGHGLAACSWTQGIELVEEVDLYRWISFYDHNISVQVRLWSTTVAASVERVTQGKDKSLPYSRCFFSIRSSNWSLVSSSGLSGFIAASLTREARHCRPYAVSSWYLSSSLSRSSILRSSSCFRSSSRACKVPKRR